MASIALAPEQPVSVKALSTGLGARFRRLSFFPSFTISSRLGLDRWLHARETRRAADAIESAGYTHLRRQIDPAADAQDPADLWHVYSTVRRNRPERCLEFGSGQTTLFTAQALADNGEGQLYTLDADARWLEHTKAMMPVELHPYVTFIHAPVAVVEDYGIPTWRYSNIPDGLFDFIVVDGPAGTDECAMSCDLVDIADRLAPHAEGMIDHRWRTAMLARECAGHRLRIRYDLLLESFLFERR